MKPLDLSAIMASASSGVRELNPGAAAITSRPSTDEQGLNKTEKLYLAHLRLNGFQWIGVQNITLKLAHDCRLTPDFAVIDSTGITFVDVKGFQREDALIKMRVAARAFPWARFQIVRLTKTKSWETQEIKP